MKIFKYPLIESISTIGLPKNAKVLTAQSQNNITYIWALIDETSDEKELRTFVIFGTGWEIENLENLTYIATFQNGIYVWHVFEEVHKKI